MKRYGNIDIYKNSDGDCSNNGLSYKFNEVNIITEYKDNDVFFENDVVILPANGGKPGFKAVPVKEHIQGKWPMFGGCFIYTSNGINPHAGQPIPLHDRFE